MASTILVSLARMAFGGPEYEAIAEDGDARDDFEAASFRDEEKRPSR
jgi:hypothetical protein